MSFFGNVNPLTAVKYVAATVVGVGTSKIVGKIIKNNVGEPENLLDKVTMLSAAWVIGGIAAERTKVYTNDTIDKTAAGVTSAFRYLKDNAALNRVNRGESTLEQEGLDPDNYRRDPSTGKFEKIVGLYDDLTDDDVVHGEVVDDKPSEN